MKNKVLTLVFMAFVTVAHAAEGMWLPLLVEQQILPAMQAEGCKLTAEQIYSAEKSCLKDAVIRLGGGCSGSFISNEGLVLTNYHCVQHYVSSASNAESNLIANGFFAKSKTEEIAMPRLTVEVLNEMLDVTEIVQDFKQQGFDLKQIKDTLTKNLAGDFQYSIEEFYAGNQYFMFKSKVYSDVRLVACMPENIASFGGDVDNWKWVRNSADFAMLRVYDNGKPFSPKNHLEICTDGVKEGEFTMVMGYPVKTQMYGTEQDLLMTYNVLNPAQIDMREVRITPMKKYMAKGEKQHNEYNARYATLANYYEKWKGEQYGIEHSQVLKKRHERDSLVQLYVNNNPDLKAKYGDLIASQSVASKAYFETFTQLVVYLEGLWRMQILNPTSRILYENSTKFLASEKFVPTVAKFNAEVEKDAFMAMLAGVTIACEKDSSLMLPTMKRLMHEGAEPQVNALSDSIFTQSVFTDSARAAKFQKKIVKKKWNDDQIVSYLEENDALYRLSEEIWNVINVLFGKYNQVAQTYDSLNSCLINVMFDIYGKNISPDANATMRVSYGKIKSLNGEKAISTTEQFSQKLFGNARIYKADSRVVELFNNKDFGKYFNGEMNFIATNQTSGGSSGSPVLNAEGKLIGVNFDRNWEGTMSDFYYDEEFCRNISVDIRYILFCIEKFGKANNIMNELAL